TSESLPDAAIDTPYSVQIEAEGGVEPYDFDLASGELPSGLTLSDSGLLSGTPDNPENAGETFVVGIQVTDSCPFRPGTDLRNYSLFVQPIIDECESLPEITTEGLQNPVLNEEYNATIEAVGGEGDLTFALTAGTLPTGLTLNVDGTITGTPTDLEEVGQQFTFDVTVTDECPFGPNSDTATFTLTLDRRITCEPVDILNTEFPDPELGQAYNAALLADGEAPFTWALVGGSLPTGIAVDPEGFLRGTATDPEQVGQDFTFTLRVTDSCELGPQIDEAEFTITLQQAPPCGSVPEITTTELPGAFFQEPYSATVEATGGVGDLTFALTEGTLPTGLTLNADGTITGTPSDLEEAGATFTFEVTVTDECPLRPGVDTQTLSIVVADIFCEEVDILNESFPDPLLGQAYNAALLASGIDPKFWELAAGSLPTGLTVDSEGFLTGTPTDAEEVGQEFIFTLRVTDSCVKGPQVDEQSFSFTLQPPPACDTTPDITTTELPGAFFQEPYNATVEATGGVGTLTFALTNGTLPTGLTLNADGTITGTPTNPEDAGGTFTFDVTVTDECPTRPGQDTATLSIVVADIFCEEVEILNESFPNPVLGQAYNAALLASGIDPKTWIIVGGTLPTGMAVDPEGFLTGTPSNPNQVGQEFTFRLRVTDSCVKGPQIDEETFSFTLQAAGTCSPLDILNTSFPDPVVFTPYNATLMAAGGSGDLTWSLVSGTLPFGLSVDPSGAITGTPINYDEVGQFFTFTLRVTDECPFGIQQDQATFTVRLQDDRSACGGPRIVNRELPSPQVGKFYDQKINVNGGVGPYTFTIVEGVLPTGLTLDPVTGHISGTPTEPVEAGQNFPILVRVADSCPDGPRTSFRRFTPVVDPATCGNLTIVSGPALPDAPAGQLYSVQLVADDGIPHFIWEVTGGTLPTGLTLNEAGRISGVPSAAEVGQTFTFDVEVTDQCHNRDQATMTITVVAP
ncbi:MAG TPA: Ig domain-containing protein, partial [bacterium]|nr:Ig domain-containing protein [bacterium]